MTWSDVARPPTRRVLRQFAGLLVAITIGLTLMGVIRAGGLPAWPPTTWAFGVGAVVVGFLGLLRPGWMRWPFTMAMLLAFPLGFAVSQLALVFLFFGLFLVIGVGLRARGRDAMVRHRRAPGSSYWEDKPQPRDPASYLRQY